MNLERRDIPKLAGHVMDRLLADGVVVTSEHRRDHLQLSIAAGIVHWLLRTGVDPSDAGSHLDALAPAIAASITESQDADVEKPTELDSAVLGALRSFSR